MEGKHKARLATTNFQGGGQPPQAGNGEEERCCGNGADFLSLYNPL